MAKKTSIDFYYEQGQKAKAAGEPKVKAPKLKWMNEAWLAGYNGEKKPVLKKKIKAIGKKRRLNRRPKNYFDKGLEDYYNGRSRGYGVSSLKLKGKKSKDWLRGWRTGYDKDEDNYEPETVKSSGNITTSAKKGSAPKPDYYNMGYEAFNRGYPNTWCWEALNLKGDNRERWLMGWNDADRDDKKKRTTIFAKPPFLSSRGSSCTLVLRR